MKRRISSPRKRPTPKRRPAKGARRTELIGMGVLISLTIVMKDGRRRVWNFREYPALAFDYVSKDASGRGRQARLFVRCGRYHITKDGRLSVERVKRQTKVSPSSVSAKVIRDFRRTHGGLAPGQAYVCRIPKAGRAWKAGRVVQMDYRADKQWTDGKEHFYHPLVDRAPPQVWVNGAGTQIYFRGGRYTVTPHGIEDLED